MAFWVSRYLADEVAGVLSPHTLEAKIRDLKSFINWLLVFVGHASLDRWLPKDTEGYAAYLVQQGRSAATINRHLASLRRFAKWAQNQPGGLLQRNGSPVRGVRDLSTDEPECKKLSPQEVKSLFVAANKLVATSKRKNARPIRDRAILSLLYYTGLRVTEVTGLLLEQLQHSHLINVRRKGRFHTKKVYLVKPCLEAMQAYIQNERCRDLPSNFESKRTLFLWPNGKEMTRRQVAVALDTIAKEASMNKNESLNVYPHKLRHTFGAIFREKTGSDTETAAALGHTGLSHVRRYVRKSQNEREEALDEMFRKDDFPT